VQTLHNFRLFCVNALFLRNGQVCEDCLGNGPWRGIVRRCYRDSLVASALVARMIAANRCLGTWHRDVNAFIALTGFAKEKYIAGGLPPDRIWVKPNFVEDPGPASRSAGSCRTLLFVGRLSAEKGVGSLLKAWKLVQRSASPQLLIIGDGPERQALQAQADEMRHSPAEVTFAGSLTPAEVRTAMMNARAVVLPSVCYENFSRVIAEAFSCARPMIVSRLGPQAQIVTHGRVGLTFPAGDDTALAQCINELLHDDELTDEYGRNSRTEYLERYSAEENHRILMSIYKAVSARNHSRHTDCVRQ
jgi:glycosyltransferase involved in cell wall biosynthesis